MRHIETLDDVHQWWSRNPTSLSRGDSQALGDHAERGSYDTGLANDVVRPGQLRQEFDEDLSWMFGYQPVIAAVNGSVAGEFRPCLLL